MENLLDVCADLISQMETEVINIPSLSSKWSTTFCYSSAIVSLSLAGIFTCNLCVNTQLANKLLLAAKSIAPRIIMIFAISNCFILVKQFNENSDELKTFNLCKTLYKLVFDRIISLKNSISDVLDTLNFTFDYEKTTLVKYSKEIVINDIDVFLSNLEKFKSSVDKLYSEIKATNSELDKLTTLTPVTLTIQTDYTWYWSKIILITSLCNYLLHIL